MLIVKDLDELVNFGFKKERKNTYVYVAYPFYLWVNPYLDTKRNRNQLVIEYFNDDTLSYPIEDEISEYAHPSLLNVIFNLIKADMIERR